MHVTCGLCVQCRTGQAHVCQNLKVIGIDADGCFAEYVSIPAGNIWKLDEKVPREYAAILDPLGNAVHTVLSGEIAGQSVAVIGCGPIGQMSVAVAKACGAATIFAIEIKPERLELARKVGADVCIDPQKEDPVKRVVGETKGVGVDVMLEMSGHPVAIHQGFQMLRAGGRASLLGIPTHKVEMDLVAEVIFKGATVQGIYGRRIFDSWYKMTALIRSGRLNLNALFTDRIAMEQFAPAFESLSSGRGSKVLMYPQGLP
jgi:threonine 3-dehydrogenase